MDVCCVLSVALDRNHFKMTGNKKLIKKLLFKINLINL